MVNTVEMKRSTGFVQQPNVFFWTTSTLIWWRVLLILDLVWTTTIVVVIVFFYIWRLKRTQREHEPCVVCCVLVFFLLFCYARAAMIEKNNFLNHHFARRKKRGQSINTPIRWHVGSGAVFVTANTIAIFQGHDSNIHSLSAIRWCIHNRSTLQLRHTHTFTFIHTNIVVFRSSIFVFKWKSQMSTCDIIIIANIDIFEKDVRLNNDASDANYHWKSSHRMQCINVHMFRWFQIDSQTRVWQSSIFPHSIANGNYSHKYIGKWLLQWIDIKNPIETIEIELNFLQWVVFCYCNWISRHCFCCSLQYADNANCVHFDSKFILPMIMSTAHTTLHWIA